MHDDAANQAILLVTDGAIDPTSLVRATTRAKRRGVRVFVVAVGESAAVEALAPFSTSTDGRLESVTPGEDIADAVMSQVLSHSSAAASAAGGRVPARCRASG